MFTTHYFNDYKSIVKTESLYVQFQRAYYDGRLTDAMNDCIKPDWIPTEDFIVYISETETHEVTTVYEDCSMTRITREVKQKQKITFSGKDVANNIWKMAKANRPYNEIVKYALASK